MVIKSKHVPLLRQLCRCNQTTAKNILKKNKDLQLCLRECAVNVLKGNVPLSKHQLKKLKRHKKQLRELSLKKTSQKRRLQIEQKGGFLASLLFPVIGSIIKSAINKKR